LHQARAASGLCQDGGESQHRYRKCSFHVPGVYRK
jgi:hypothetical protein